MVATFHPCAEIFPLREGAEFDALVADIKQRGATPLFVTRDFITEIDRPFDDRSELEQYLLDDLEEIAVELLGVPTGYSTWHWGPKKLIIKGLRRGWFDDWEAGVHGWPLKMIAHEINGDEAKAIAWVRNRLGIGQLPPPDAETLKAREKKRCQAAAVEAALQRFKIIQAQALWAHSTLINNTAAERYLVWVRKVPIRYQWPEAVRCDPFGNLIVALTTDDGTITAVQRVLLTNNGERQVYCDDDGVWKKKKKFTTGIMAGAYVRLPGWSNGELVIAEGPEDALSIWAAGLETFTPCRVITSLYPPHGRKIVIARNDDPQPSPVDASYLKGKVRWAKAGVNFREAFPWPERRFDKTDFNDLLRADGIAAVKKALRSPAPAAIPLRFTANETRDKALVRANQDFFKELRMHHAIRVTLGTGKSSINRDEIASFVRSMRADGDKRSVVIAVPTNRLADEAAVDFPDDIRRATWRGYGADNPLRPSETMCMNLEMVTKVRKVMGDVPTTCCRKPARDGAPEMKCEFYDTCAYQAQKHQRADVWYTPHHTLFSSKPEAMGKVAALIIDEDPINAGLEVPVWLPLDALAKVTHGVFKREKFDIDDAMRDLKLLRLKLLRAFRKMPDGPITRAALRDAHITGDDTSRGRQWEFGRKVELNIYPGMPDTGKALKAAAGNRTIMEFGMMWDALRALTDAGGPEVSGWIELVTGKDGRGLWLRGRKEIAAGFAGVPTLVMGAHIKTELLNYFWPDIELTTDIAVAAPYQHVRQVIDENYGKNRFAPEKDTPAAAERRRDVHAIVARIARQYWPKQVLVIVQIDLEEHLQKLPIPANVEMDHFGNIEGVDKWRRVRAVVVVGRPAPGPLDVERDAMALTGRAVPSVGERKWYPPAIVPREMADGTFRPGVADQHPDPTAEAMRWVICEGGVMQAIGRPRGVNRTEVDPVDVWLLTDVVVPVPVDETLQAADIAPTAADLMLAAGGIAFGGPKDAAKAYPQLWPSAGAAKKAFQRETGDKPFSKKKKRGASYKGLSPVSTWTYRRAGARGPVAVAAVDETRHADPAAAIAAKIGRLSLVERVGPRASPVERATTPGEALNAILGTGLLGRERPKSPWEEYATHVVA